MMFPLLLVATLVVLFLVVVVVTRFPRRSRSHLVAGRTRGMIVYRPTTLDEAQLVSFWPFAAWQARVRRGLVADGGVVELFILRDVTFAQDERSHSHPHISSQLLDEELHLSTRQVQKGDVPAYGVTASGVGLRLRALPVRSPAARRDVKLLCRLDAVFGGGA